jgi:hypothetical protein
MGHDHLALREVLGIAGAVLLLLIALWPPRRKGRK